MKKQLLLSVFVVTVVCVLIHKEDDKKVIPFFGAKVVKQIKTEVAPALKSGDLKEIESVSFESLEEAYSDLELSELKSEIEKVNSSQEKLRLIEAFNQRKLTDLEEKALAGMIKTRVVLTKLMLEKEFEELERL